MLVRKSNEFLSEGFVDVKAFFGADRNRLVTEGPLMAAVLVARSFSARIDEPTTN